MISILDKLLSKLPGNGWKSVVGFILTYIPFVFPGFPVGTAQTLIEQIGEVLLTLGILHKAVKEVRK